MDDEDAVLLTDALATGYFGAQLGDIVDGDVVVVFGAGPVGLFAAKSAYRLEKARTFAHAEASTSPSTTTSSCAHEGGSPTTWVPTWPSRPLDPIIVAAPWLVAGGVAYVGLTGLFRAVERVGRRG